MLRNCILFITLCAFFYAPAQKNKADSLAALLATEKTDTNRVTLLWRLAEATSFYNTDSALPVAQRALFLAENIRYTEGRSRTLGIMANIFMKMGNYAQALGHNFKKLQIEETRDKPRNLASVLMNIGSVYVLQEQPHEALKYYRKSDSIINARNIDELRSYSSLQMGDVYSRLNIADSAFLYFERTYDLAMGLNDARLIGASRTGMAYIRFLQNQYPQSLNLYREAITQLVDADNELYCEAALGMARVYQALAMPDSAIRLATQCLRVAQNDKLLPWQLDAAKFLAEQYKIKNRFDSAYTYTYMAFAVNDSLNNKTRIREAQALSMNEQVRQAELEESKRKQEKQRKKQLQLLFIALFIPGFFLLTLLLSRIRVPRKTITILGILSLLIFFEFLTLLLHPFVVKITGHRPVLEILIFVAVAAFLIPAHHRLEHWLIHRLTSIKPREPKIKIKKTRISIKKDAPGKKTPDAPQNNNEQ